MGHPVFEAGPAERDGRREDHDLALDVIAPVTPERGVGMLHRLTSHVVPSLESFSTIPWAASSSRMRSDSLKSFALRAALRSAIRPSMRASSMSPLWRLSKS